jgi:SEC-C motif-containing protein
MRDAQQCYCGSGVSYAHCCQPLHQYQQQAMTPEALMRSRYAAYSLADIDYIQATMQGRASEGFDATTAKQWAERVVWIGLEVVRAEMLSSEEGVVEFIATFVDDQMVHHMHELSRFIRVQERWYYVDGKSVPSVQVTTQVTRNSLCPCGSTKKWKHCHGKASSH